MGRRAAMLAAERHARILRAVEQRSAVRVAELAELLGVTPMTIRRDLDRLASQGKLDKVHGGATVAGATRAGAEEPGFEATWAQQGAEKEAIALAAAAMVRPGSTVGLAAGTTTSRLARHLRAVPGLTVVTNSVRVAEALHEPGAGGAPDVVLTGGVRTHSDALVGPVAVSSLRLLHLDLVFLGVRGVHARAGLTTHDVTAADTERALVDAGRCLVVLADHTKWGLVGTSAIAPLGRADVLISDEGLADEGRAAITRAGVHLVLAEGGGADAGPSLPLPALHQDAAPGRFAR